MGENTRECPTSCAYYKVDDVDPENVWCFKPGPYRYNYQCDAGGRPTGTTLGWSGSGSGGHGSGSGYGSGSGGHGSGSGGHGSGSGSGMDHGRLWHFKQSA